MSKRKPQAGDDIEVLTNRGWRPAKVTELYETPSPGFWFDYEGGRSNVFLDRNLGDWRWPSRRRNDKGRG